MSSYWISKKRKDYVILKEQPFDFKGCGVGRGWGCVCAGGGVEVRLKKNWNPGSGFAGKSNQDMVTVAYMSRRFVLEVI